MDKRDFLLEIYKDPRTVFGLSDVAMLFPHEEGKYLSGRLRYYVQTDRLLNPRKGIYAKPDYNPLELANILYTPSYISLEYVLQQAGVVFQFDSRITSVGYLSREMQIDGRMYSYRRIKDEVIIDITGIERKDNVNIASPERAFLDTLYLNKNFYFDNLNPLDSGQIEKILPTYRSVALEKRIAKLLKNG
jgi:hypothetical protein